MAEATIGAAVLRTRLDQSGFKAGFVQARGEAKKFAADVSADIQKAGQGLQSFGKAMSVGVTAPVVAAGAAALVAADKLGSYADRILDLEQITGLTTDTLQEFENVARIAGVSSEVLAGAAEAVTRRLRAAGEESATFTANVQALGVSTRDANGNLRSTNDLVPEIITKLQGMSDITERNAIASQIFGRSASELAPVLGLTAQGFAEARQQARDMGQVLV